jgi:hypothetical protein
LLALEILLNFDILRKGFSKIFIVLFSDLFFDNFLDGIEMIIFEYIVFEIFELLITERTAMMPIDSLLNARPAIDMPASSNVTVSYRIKTDCTLELGLKLLWAYLEVSMVGLLLNHHRGLFFYWSNQR